jgi:hypothetical protein
MPFLIASGSVGHASNTAAKLGSIGASRAPTAPHSAPPEFRIRVFRVECAGCSNPVPATCLGGSEKPLPSGYTKGQRSRTLAFLRFIATRGKNFQRLQVSRRLTIWPARAEFT